MGPGLGATAGATWVILTLPSWASGDTCFRTLQRLGVPGLPPTDWHLGCLARSPPRGTAPACSASEARMGLSAPPRGDGWTNGQGRTPPPPPAAFACGGPSTPCLAPSPTPPQGPGQLLCVPNRGAQSHIPRQMPALPPTSALLSTSGKAALYCPPWGPSAASGAQETGD